MDFEKNVFVNCPFDEEYIGLLRPLLFTVIYLGFTPRIALEALDSGSPRVEKITKLVRESKYGIHDLSRLKAKRKGEFFRLNMPFELGLDVGCRMYGAGKLKSKRCLILEEENYRYQAAISDISNSDIATHSAEPERIVREVRNWLASNMRKRPKGPAAVWGAYIDFMSKNYDDLVALGYSKRDVELLPVNELMEDMEEWVSKTHTSQISGLP